MEGSEILCEWIIGWQQNRLRTKSPHTLSRAQEWVRTPSAKCMTLHLFNDFSKTPLAAQEESWPILGSGINRLIKAILKNSFPFLKYISHWVGSRGKFLSGPWLIFLWTEAEWDRSLGVWGSYPPGYCTQGFRSWVQTPAPISQLSLVSCSSNLRWGGGPGL